MENEPKQNMVFRFSGDDKYLLRLVSQHMVGEGRMIEAEMTGAMRFLIRDYVRLHRLVEKTTTEQVGK